MPFQFIRRIILFDAEEHGNKTDTNPNLRAVPKINPARPE